MSTSGTTSEVQSTIKVVASKELAEEIKKELQLADPDDSVAKAILEGKTNDQQNG